MVYIITKYIKEINKIYNYIINNKFNKNDYYNCMSEVLILLKNTFKELNNIYNKYILIPKLKNFL
jgi:hypothetical protein|tara:strand:+ start:77 stop:271 length:195 start_codon:yes stop_codon:yes gene_type:complete